MKNNKHNRHSVRLKNYDYSQTGAYFVTVCAQDKKCVFGKIENHELILNDAGIMVYNTFKEIPEHYAGIDIDEFIIMPNHIHAIIIINTVGADPRVCPESHICLDTMKLGQAQGPAPTNKLKLSDIVQRVKSLTTKKYIENVKQNNWKSFNKRLWQRNYYEHVIRDEEDLNKIREYIIYNYLKWVEDDENPDKISKKAD